jgi:hypothetical protein
VTQVQEIWQKLYNLPETFPTNGSQWDHLFADRERFAVGGIEARALLSPGHTLCSITYVIGDAAFVHDTVFMPDSGTARADFPGGDAQQLWRSIQRILQLPDDTRLFTGHDYRPNGRKARWKSTVAAQRAHNSHLKDHDETTFVQFRNKRDRSLPLPNLMLSAQQVNIAGGRLPPPEQDERRYLKLPLNAVPLVSSVRSSSAEAALTDDVGYQNTAAIRYGSIDLVNDSFGRQADECTEGLDPTVNRRRTSATGGYR